MTWKSTVEFQLIHEDYQRARKGISTLYSDHFEALSDSKRQLSIILLCHPWNDGSCAWFPSKMISNSGNMISLVGYVAVVIFGVIVLIGMQIGCMVLYMADSPRSKSKQVG